MRRIAIAVVDADAVGKDGVLARGVGAGGLGDGAALCRSSPALERGRAQLDARNRAGGEAGGDVGNDEQPDGVVAIDAHVRRVERIGAAMRRGAGGDLRRREQEIEHFVRRVRQLEGGDRIGLARHDFGRDVANFLDEQVDLAVDRKAVRCALLALVDAPDLIIDGGGIGDRGTRGRPGGKRRGGSDACKRRQTDGAHISQLAGHS